MFRINTARTYPRIRTHLQKKSSYLKAYSLAGIGTMAALNHATANDIILSASDTKGTYHTPFTSLTGHQAKLTGTLLNENHRNFHIYFNDKGFHNHLVHHLLTLYALGADPGKIRNAYDSDASYQLPLGTADSSIVADMQKDRRGILKYLPGDEKQIDMENEVGGKQYVNFLDFWTKEIERSGVKQVLEQWVFKGDEVAEKIYGRLYSGFLHPFIHAGFALEFHQPAIMAEALAQACVHENWVYPLIQGCREGSAKLKSSNISPRPLSDLLQEAYNNKNLRASPHSEDGNKLRDGVLARAKQDLLDIASQWFVPDIDVSWDTVNEKIAEHIHAAFLFTSTAALHTTVKSDGTKIRHQPRLDFFYIHDTNASIFLSAIASDPKLRDSIGLKNTINLLESKAWVDLGMYVSRGSPAITAEKLEQIQTYEPRTGTRTASGNGNNASRGRDWDWVFDRVTSLPDDDSHAVKFIRALANAERACKPYEDRAWCVIKGDMWLRIGWMAIDSWSNGSVFVRNAGWDESWEDVPEWK